MRKVIIEPWSQDGDFVHCHDPEFVATRSHYGGVVQATLSDFREIGLISGSLSRVESGKSPGWYLEGSCQTLCELVQNVSSYDENELDRVRGQLESIDVHLELSNFELAYLDLDAREALADEARSVENPFGVDARYRLLSQAVQHALDMYFARREKVNE